MRPLSYCGFPALLLVGTLGAQPIPARDLLEFPLGAVFEPAALAAEPGAGLWNPAAGMLRRGDRWRFSVTALTTAQDQGVAGQLLSAAWRRPGGVTFAMPWPVTSAFLYTICHGGTRALRSPAFCGVRDARSTIVPQYWQRSTRA